VPLTSAQLWAAQQKPAPGPARIYGATNSGCLEGANALPSIATAHYALVRPERRRNYGHPLLVEYIVHLSEQLRERNLPRLGVGDLSQARGGPAPSGHSSHQTGIDVDLWYLAAEPGRDAPLIVDENTQQALPTFVNDVKQLLELAARAKSVDRIFVNPLVKHKLCQETQGDKAWLRVLRPWWGHADHFHVRLRCPVDSPGCKPQPALPAGDGCAELPYWLDKKSDAERAKGAQSYKKRIGKADSMPAECRQVVQPNSKKP
jgi:penicillin-insensitive murein DD-endopeptidase